MNRKMVGLEMNRVTKKKIANEVINRKNHLSSGGRMGRYDMCICFKCVGG